MTNDSASQRFVRHRLGDCWIDGCLRDAFAKVTFTEPRTKEQVTGLLCDEHAEEAQS